MVKIINFVLLNFTRVFTRLLLNSIKIFKKMILFTLLTLRFLKFQLLDTYTYSKALKKTCTRHFRFYSLLAISTYSENPWFVIAKIKEDTTGGENEDKGSNRKSNLNKKLAHRTEKLSFRNESVFEDSLVKTEKNMLWVKPNQKTSQSFYD